MRRYNKLFSLSSALRKKAALLPLEIRGKVKWKMADRPTALAVKRPSGQAALISISVCGEYLDRNINAAVDTVGSAAASQLNDPRFESHVCRGL